VAHRHDPTERAIDVGLIGALSRKFKKLGSHFILYNLVIFKYNAKSMI
jgi:hypothetical protein